MWSRVVELMLGCWLMMSPFVFRHAPDETALWASDFACGSAVVLFALLSYWRPTQHAHLLSLAVGGWLMVFAYVHGFGTAPAASQNHLILGMSLLMFAVIPNDAARPAPVWEHEAAGD